MYIHAPIYIHTIKILTSHPPRQNTHPHLLFVFLCCPICPMCRWLRFVGVGRAPAAEVRKRQLLLGHALLRAPADGSLRCPASRLWGGPAHVQWAAHNEHGHAGAVCGPVWTASSSRDSAASGAHATLCPSAAASAAHADARPCGAARRAVCQYFQSRDRCGGNHRQHVQERAVERAVSSLLHVCRSYIMEGRRLWL